jgi:hypothetical protein
LRKTLITWGTPWEFYENGLGTKKPKNSINHKKTNKTIFPPLPKGNYICHPILLQIMK